MMSAEQRPSSTDDPAATVLGDLVDAARRLIVPTDRAEMTGHMVDLAAELVTGATVDLEQLMPDGDVRLLASSPAVGHARTSERGDGTSGGWRPAGPRFEFALGTQGRHQQRLRFQFADDSCVTATAWPLAAAYAIYAGVVNERISLLEEIDHLQEAVQTNREIGAAVGVLMVRHRVTYEEAFDELRKASQHSNRKLRDIATEVVYTGDMPLVQTMGGR